MCTHPKFPSLSIENSKAQNERKSSNPAQVTAHSFLQPLLPQAQYKNTEVPIMPYIPTYSIMNN